MQIYYAAIAYTLHCMRTHSYGSPDLWPFFKLQTATPTTPAWETWFKPILAFPHLFVFALEDRRKKQTDRQDIQNTEMATSTLHYSALQCLTLRTVWHQQYPTCSKYSMSEDYKTVYQTEFGHHNKTAHCITGRDSSVSVVPAVIFKQQLYKKKIQKMPSPRTLLL